MAAQVVTKRDVAALLLFTEDAHMNVMRTWPGAWFLKERILQIKRSKRNGGGSRVRQATPHTGPAARVSPQKPECRSRASQQVPERPSNQRAQCAAQGGPVLLERSPLRHR